jgi:hypothetical protein
MAKRNPTTNAGPVALVDAEGDAEDGVVLRPHDHRAHDEDLRVGEYPDGREHAGDRQQDEPAGGVGSETAHPGVDLFPDGREVLAEWLAALRPGGDVRDRRLDGLDHDRAPPVHLQAPELSEDLIGFRQYDVELHGVTVRRPRRILEDDDVQHSGVGEQGLDEPRGHI